MKGYAFCPETITLSEPGENKIVENAFNVHVSDLHELYILEYLKQMKLNFTPVCIHVYHGHSVVGPHDPNCSTEQQFLGTSTFQHFCLEFSFKTMYLRNYSLTVLPSFNKHNISMKKTVNCSQRNFTI